MKKLKMKGLIDRFWIFVLPKNFSGGQIKGVGLNLLSGTLITNQLAPSDIEDVKKMNFKNYAIPGLNYTPFNYVNGDDTRITFSVPFINREKKMGNRGELAQLENLRNNQLDIAFTSESIWNKQPICIYSGFGTHRPPLPVVVEDCKFVHKQSMFNQGWIEMTDVTFTMRYLESSLLYRIWRKSMKLLDIRTMKKNMSKKPSQF
jgi:hypothetical protein